MSRVIQSEKVEVNGMYFDINRCEDEKDEMILFLHGFPQTNYSWRHQLPWLAEKGYYCVAPNQRGYSDGARPHNVADYATELLVHDMLKVIAACGHDNAHVVGHDWGGMISWLLAALHPAQVRTLSVLSRPHPTAFTLAMQQDPAQANRSSHHQTFQDPDAAKRLLDDGAKRLRGALSSQHVPDADIDVYLKALGDFEALNAAINWYRQTGGLSQLVANFPVVNVPTLYIWGTEDATVGRAAATGTKDYVAADYRFVELPGIGHFITDQLVELVNDELLKHISLA